MSPNLRNKPVCAPADAGGKSLATAAGLLQKLYNNEQKAPKKILLVSYYCPSRVHAGGLRILDIYQFIKTNYPHVKLDLFTCKRPIVDAVYTDIERIFDGHYYATQDDLSPSHFQFIAGATAGHYDVVDLQFHETGCHIQGWRAFGSKIIFTPMESQVKMTQSRLNSGAFSQTGPELVTSILGLRPAAQEIVYATQSDETVCVSESDSALLALVSQVNTVSYMDTALSTIEFADAIANQNMPLAPEHKPLTVVYCASYVSQGNRETLKWYLENAHPLILKAVPAYRFQVVGFGCLDEFRALQPQSVDFIGAVNDVSPAISAAKVGIAPVIYGTGFRGKIVQYAICGVPCVASSVAIYGIKFTEGVDILIGDTTEDFAKHCIDLLLNNDVNKTIATNARAVAAREYTWESKRAQIEKIYNL